MNKSLFTKLFIPIGLLGVVVILVVLLAVSQDFLQDLLVPLIIWIPVWAVVSLALTILDGKKHLGLDAKLSKIMGKKSKSKEKPVEIEEKPQVDICEVVSDVVTPSVKFDKPISTIVIFDNAAVKDGFKTFCDNGFKLGENPKSVPKPDPLFVTENKPAEVEKELPELVFILDEESVPAFITENQADILVRDSAEIVKPEIKVVTDVPVVEVMPAEEVLVEEKPQVTTEEKVPPVVAKSKKRSLFKKSKSKTAEIEKNEEAIFDPVETNTRVKKYSPSVITDERLVKIVKNPELITPAELALINGNIDLKKRYYELMTALYDEED